jgi:DNA-binding MarR family transcriptional regulator
MKVNTRKQQGGESRPSHQAGYRLELQIGFALRQASQRHASIFVRHMIDQITPMQWAALVKLHELGASSQNRLGRETAMDVATIKGVIDRLSARGLVETSQDQQDARRINIRLTNAGSATVEKGLPVAQRITEETVHGLNTPERATLLRLLRKIS